MRRMVTVADREEISRGVAEGLLYTEIAVRCSSRRGMLSSTAKRSPLVT